MTPGGGWEGRGPLSPHSAALPVRRPLPPAPPLPVTTRVRGALGSDQWFLLR